MNERRINPDPIEESLRSPKVDFFLASKYQFDISRHNPDDEDPKIGLIIEVESPDVEVEGIISKGENHILVCVPYSKIPSIIGNPQVRHIDWGDDDLLKLARSSDSDEVTIKCPWDGPKGDEWDSAGYASVWDGAERFLNERILTLQKIGKKVKVV